MTISELIEVLNRQLKSEGDLDVYFYDVVSDCTRYVDSVDIVDPALSSEDYHTPAHQPEGKYILIYET